ncbi:hypothetical protein CW751_03660 [Brumimicrobium salinarum]|uniref:Methylmalonyl-CoA mutase alpha/beta chain catalytic domain-containing protein n=1 Tax=Brumimicrobium salinarum TaxID=2058658 RepID=A0A2I0R4W4_9FLAO|nr:methylmalonyl-CoA mutase family protein [Brumimicrobium salinarum]PKR81632.1 hypothetical protein CW751_03660 [Brumimicrobium salinarum]
MNAFALQQLMNGATALTIDISSFDLNECHEIVKNIGFEHITSTIIYKTQAQFDWLNKLTAQDAFFGTTICTEQNNFGFIKNARNKLVRAIDVHHAGGNAKQEIAFALHEGHEVLYNLIKSGISVDDAAPQIKFQFGLGSSYFIEITKFKVFRALWQTIVSHYHPKHSCSAIPYIEAETGFINKSLKDPHNNLLRQTTEASAAIIGGVDELTIRPYDAWSTQPMFDKTQRLGLNIALMLKEESYLDKVIDPAGGAYVLQSLYEELKEKSWDLFQSLEQSFDLKSDIQRVADIRTSLVNKKQQTLIGVNKFLNETPEEQNWKLPANTRFGTPLVLENACKVEI